MGVTKKPSGVNIIGLGAEDLNQFKPVDQLKDLYIQLTADGATDESMDYLAYLKSYAEHNQSIGLPIMPNGVNVWISNNGKTSAVEADDLSLEDGVYTICGIKCEDGEWDFTNAGQHSGGGGGGGVLVVKIYDNAEGEYLYFDKTFSEIETALSDGIPVYVMCEVQAGNPDHNVFAGFFFSGASYYSALDKFAVGILDLSRFYEDIFTTSDIVFLADSASDTLKASYSQS